MKDTNYAIPTVRLRKQSHCLKRFVPVTQAGVFIWENFHSGYRNLGRKNRDLGNRATPASHMNTSKFLRRIAWRDEILETEPAPLTGLIMKRPLTNSLIFPFF